jgi:phosphotransferase system enzyme I (PtsP)
MPSAPGGPRLLLRRLREIMAEPVGAQDRLDKIVILIAANMVAEVCSVYVMRGDGVLELFATEGLNREAVHLTTMRSGEGLVGLIASTAEPLSLSDAQTHPAYSYKPETGEEVYHAFLGVPLLRAGNTLGVLVVQNRTYRVYTEEEMEALQTTAMVLAEMIATGELQALAPVETGIALRRPLYQKGISLAEGVGLGHVVLHEPRVVVKNLIAENVDAEIKRLDAAIGEVRTSIDQLIERGDVAHHGEHREVLETFRMFAHDQGWLRRMREAVTSGLTAEAAVERVQSDNRARMLRQTDPYLRERLHDLDDLANRLLHRLVGRDLVAERGALPDNAIIVARSMGPAALLDYDRSRLRGLVLEEGGPTSHIAIVARALGIPAVGEVANATSLTEPGDPIIVDGRGGRRADQAELRRGGGLCREGAASGQAPGTVSQAAGRALRHQGRGRDHPSAQCRPPGGPAPPGRDRGGGRRPVPHGTAVHDRRADALGLRAAGALQRRVRRDRRQARHLPHPRHRRRQDPALHAVRRGGEPGLGWRAIRIGLDRPGLLRAQVRALLKAASGRPLKLMFPMVATCDEFERAKKVVEREKNYLSAHGHPLPSDLKLGVMLEVPSLLFQLKEICESADFVSIGTNDLMQFLFAVDRENRRVADRFDPLSAPMLRALSLVAEQARASNCQATICGEIGGRPLEAMALIGLGFHSLSMSPASIGPVKAMLLDLDVAEIQAFLREELNHAGGGETLRPKLAHFAETHGIPI